MSSFTRGGTQNDAGLQLAPAEGDGPDLLTLRRAYETTLNDCQPFASQCRLNTETRFAIWPGQSSDGKKHAREGSKIAPTPWDGASDLRVYEVDNVINYKVARNAVALRKASIVANPTNGTVQNIERAKTVGLFTRWLITSQIPQLEREEELLSNYLYEKGIAATGQFWETVQEKMLATLKLSDFQRAVPSMNVQQLIEDPALADNFVTMIEQNYGTSAKKAKQVLKSLRDTGEATVPVNGRKKSRPIIRAFTLDHDLFVPSWATDIEHAPYIFRIEYFSAEQLRSLINSDNWDEAWVEQAIEKCRGQTIASVPDTTLQPISRSFVYVDQKNAVTEKIGVVYAYQRLSDPDDNVTGIYLTIFNPHLPADGLQDGYAKFGLLGYAHGEYPFVIHRAEFLTRRFHDSRGLPEPGKPWQDQIKAHRDSRIDAASWAIIPPLFFPMGRPPGKWGPGAQIPERRSGEYHFGDKPTGDVLTENSEKILMESWREYAGIRSAEGDPLMVNLKNQHEVEKYLSGWAAAYRQVFKLYQQFGDDQVYFRVAGLKKASPDVMTKGDPTEDYDFNLTYDVLSQDFEQMKEKLMTVAQIVQTSDKYGQIDYSAWLQIMINVVDANWAEQIIKPQEAATQQNVNEMHNILSQTYTGVEKDMPMGMPPQLAMQTIQNYVQSPDVAQRLQNKDDPFTQRMERLVKQIQMVMSQQQNAEIGKLGTPPAKFP